LANISLNIWTKTLNKSQKWRHRQKTTFSNLDEILMKTSQSDQLKLSKLALLEEGQRVEQVTQFRSLESVVSIDGYCEKGTI